MTGPYACECHCSAPFHAVYVLDEPIGGRFARQGSSAHLHRHTTVLARPCPRPHLRHLRHLRHLHHLHRTPALEFQAISASTTPILFSLL